MTKVGTVPTITCVVWHMAWNIVANIDNLPTQAYINSIQFANAFQSRDSLVEDEDFVMQCDDESIPATLTFPIGSENSKPRYMLILTHGTGSDHHLPQLQYIAHFIVGSSLGCNGWSVLRFTRRGTNVERIAKSYEAVVVRNIHFTPYHSKLGYDCVIDCRLKVGLIFRPKSLF